MTIDNRLKTYRFSFGHVNHLTPNMAEYHVFEAADDKKAFLYATEHKVTKESLQIFKNGSWIWVI